VVGLVKEAVVCVLGFCVALSLFSVSVPALLSRSPAELSRGFRRFALSGHGCGYGIFG
jgi:hypothetical protein